MAIALDLLLSLVAILLVSHFGVAKSTALFVFGDSYADTGNHDPNAQNISNEAWRYPYGSTYPGQPNGRFSDGFVLTDQISQILGLSAPPIPIRQVTRSIAEGTRPDVTLGINFAFGGSGAFETYGPQYPPIKDQIQEFQSFICDPKGYLYNATSPSNAFALYVLSGNDYNAYVQKHGIDDAILRLVRDVNIQLQTDLKSLIELGFQKIVVTNLHPIGCIPKFTVDTNYTRCGGLGNLVSLLHNYFVNETASDLATNYTQAHILVLDHYRAFDSIIHNPEKFGMKEPFRPCCHAEAPYSCSDVDAGDLPRYTICSEPETAFYWDNFHPTNAAWGKIMGVLFDDLNSTLATYP